MASTEAENRHLKKRLEVAEQMYDKLLDDFKKLKAHSLLLEEDNELLRKPKTQEPWRPAAEEESQHYNQTQTLVQIESPRADPWRNAPIPRKPDRYYNCPSGKGPIVFGNCDVGGEFLELENITYRAVNIGYFIIRRILGEREIEVLLPSSTKIQAKSKLVIFARNSETPILKSSISRIVLENVEHWLSGELMQTFLLDSRGTEIASVVQGLEKVEEETINYIL